MANPSDNAPGVAADNDPARHHADDDPGSTVRTIAYHANNAAANFAMWQLAK